MEDEENPRKHLDDYMAKFSKCFSMPQTTYEDACFHPKFDNYIITLGKVVEQKWEDARMGFDFSNLDLQSISAQYPELFKKATEFVQEIIDKDLKATEKEEEIKAETCEAEKEDSEDDRSYVEMVKKEQFHDESYEGGESDEESKNGSNKNEEEDGKELFQRVETQDDLVDHLIDNEGIVKKDKKRNGVEELDVEEEKVTNENLNDSTKRPDTRDSWKKTDEVNFLDNENNKNKTETLVNLLEEEIKMEGENNSRNKVFPFQEGSTIAPNEIPEEKIDNADQTTVEPPLVEKTLFDNFNEMPLKYRQIAFDMIMDEYIEKLIPKYLYQGFEQEFLPKESNYEVPADEQPFMDPIESSYSQKYYSDYYTSGVYGDLVYKPKILREKYQISLWKIDMFGVVRVKDRYFTPKSKKIEDEEFCGFEFVRNSGNEQIILRECDYEDEDKYTILTLVIDPFNLKVKSEMEIIVRDKDFKVEDYGAQMDYEDYRLSCYPTSKYLEPIACWNDGKYLMSSVFACNCDHCVYFLVYDTETKSVISKIERIGELKTPMIFSFKPDPSDSNILYLPIVKDKAALIGKLNIITKKLEPFSKPFQLEDSIPEYFEFNITTNQVNICLDDQCISYQAGNPLDFHKKLNRINSISNSSIKHKTKINEGIACNYCDIHKIFPKNNLTLVVNINHENNIEILTSEGISFAPFMNKDYCISQEAIVDISQLNNSQAAMIIKIKNKFKVIYVYADAEKKSKIFEIKQLTMISFKYPYVTVIKECTEIFQWSVQLKKLY